MKPTILLSLLVLAGCATTGAPSSYRQAAPAYRPAPRPPMFTPGYSPNTQPNLPCADKATETPLSQLDRQETGSI